MAWTYMSVILTKEFPVTVIFCVNLVLVFSVGHAS